MESMIEEDNKRRFLAQENGSTQIMFCWRSSDLGKYDDHASQLGTWWWWLHIVPGEAAFSILLPITVAGKAFN